MNTSSVWSNQGLFYSQQGKAAPKGIRSRITVPSQMTVWEAAATVELAGRIGFHLPDLPLPVYESLFVQDQLDPKLPLSLSSGSSRFHLVLGSDWEWLAKVVGQPILSLRPWRQKGQPESGILSFIREEGRTILVVTGTSPQMTLRAARALASEQVNLSVLEDAAPLLIPAEEPLPSSGAAESKEHVEQQYSLHNLFTTEGIFQRNAGELLPTLDVSLAVTQASREATAAFSELAARLAQAAGYVCFPLTHTADEGAHSDRFVIELDTDVGDAASERCLALREDCRALRLTSHSTRLLSLIREILDEGLEPLDAWQQDTWRHRFAALKSRHSDVSLRARLGMQTFTRARSDEIFALHVPEHLAQPSELWRNYVGTSRDEAPVPIQIDAEQPIWTAKWDDPGELAEMETYLLDQARKLREENPSALSLSIEVTTTCSEPTFRAWSDRLQASVYEQGGLPVQLMYRDANKSGLNWAMQEVLPPLKELAGIHRIELRARAFRPSEKHLDLVHRYLQELYPFDSILADELGLPLEQISLGLDEDSSAPMFSVAAFADDGRKLAAWSWEGWVESLPYMPERPSRGNVMVPFAGIRIYAEGSGRELASRSFAPNPYRFWKWYQQTALPRIFEQVGSNPGVPKFSRLECHVGMDAVEKKVPHLEENSSVLEALHEDIYFFTLHAMHDHGKKVGDPEWDAPGGILPFMHVEPGAKPWASLALYAFPSDHRVSVIGSERQAKTIAPIAAEAFAGARITRLVRGERDSSFSFAGFTDPRLEADCGSWLAAAGERAESAFEEYDISGLREKSIWEDVFVNEDVRQWLKAKEKDIPGKVNPIDFSLNGRWIWMVELFAQEKKRANVSRWEKHGLYKPTFFINARHHANEVSSTNAALQLIEKLAADPAVLESVNLVIVPLENVDGAALHGQMAEEHPCWKWHAARYNACGLEFAKYRFQDQVPFGESRVYPKVWERWAPDIVLDDHGIPSHEWIQPFSGYNSPPRFPVSYWIPSARMYTIWRELTEASCRQREAYESLRGFVTRRLDEDQEVAADNKAWLNTYRRWGNDFDSVHFPIELSNGSIAYTRHSPINRASHDLIERFPEWVTADLMTEVNDETVYKKELAACRQAHHVVHQAIVDWVKDRPVQVSLRSQPMANKTTRIGLERTRPL